MQSIETFKQKTDMVLAMVLFFSLCEQFHLDVRNACAAHPKKQSKHKTMKRNEQLFAIEYTVSMNADRHTFISVFGMQIETGETLLLACPMKIP